MGGLWNIPSGVITKPGGALNAGLHQEVFYLPQKPYNVLGTLVDQMTYPDDSRAARDLGREELRAILAQVDPSGSAALFAVATRLHCPRLHHRAGTLYQIHEDNRCLSF